MNVSHSQIFLIAVILVMAIATFLTRLIPFFLSKQLKNHRIQTLGRYLPCGIMLILTIYSIESLKTIDYHYLINGILATIVTAIIHLVGRNALLSIVLGTGVYYLLLHHLIL